MKTLTIILVGVFLLLSPLTLSPDSDSIIFSSQSSEIDIEYTPHVTIRIDSDADFATEGLPGSGISGDPWLIEGYEIDGTGLGFSIYIGNTTDYFTVKDCELHHASGGSANVYFNNSALIINNAENGQIINNSIHNSTHGIRLSTSNNNSIMLNELRDNGFGLLIEGLVAYKPHLNFYGENVDDSMGRFVDGVGDIDKDGYDDFIMSAPGFNSDTGKAYIMSGFDGSEIYSYVGEAVGDQFGGNVNGLGDVNLDTYPDFMVSAAYNDETDIDAGKVYVYSGIDGSILYEKVGEVTGDQFGGGASNAGDVNNDGYMDFIIGAQYWDRPATVNWGKIYVYSGLDGSELYWKRGEARNYEYGCSVGYAGDVDNDGFDDFMVGSWGFDDTGANEGKTYIYSGQTGLELWSYIGENNLDNMGRTSGSIYYAGDLDQDGFDDFIVSSPRWESTGTTTDNNGRVYVYSGQTGSQIYAYGGEGIDDRLGRRVGGIGDVDLDGVDDFLVTSAWHNSLAGKVYIYSGATGNQIYEFNGVPVDELGVASSAGDVNNDGYLDLIMGAYNNSDGGASTGQVYVYISSPPWSRNNTIEANDIISNTNYGVWIKSGSSLNSIFHNNFFNNGAHVGDNAANTWDDGYPSGGNYWDNYVGIDVNSGPLQDAPPSDGIGDIPNLVAGAGANIDQYPLMLPFSYKNFQLTLNQGWNLISIPLATDSTAILDVLASIDSDWDLVMWYDASDAAQILAVTNELVFGPAVGTETGPFYLDYSNILDCTLYSTDELFMIPESDYDLDKATGQITYYSGPLSAGESLIAFYNYSSPGNHWKSYNKNALISLSDISDIDHEIGFWINITAPTTTLSLWGQKAGSTTINLKAGWNMVGYPANSDAVYDIADLKADTGATDVAKSNSLLPYNLETPADNYILQSGEGYWIKVSSDTSWTVNW